MEWPRYILVLVVFSLFLPNLDCGSKRIYGGRVVKIEEYPYYVLVNKICGGSIIGPRWVITASHCIDGGKKIYLYAGMESLSDVTRVKRLLLGVFFHPIRDLALVKLDRPFPFGRKIKPIDLPLKGEDIRYSVLETIGYGLTETAKYSENLKAATHTKIDTLECYKYKKSEVKYWLRRNMTWDDWLAFHRSIVCIEKVNGEGVCAGDSGGPLVARRASGAPVLLGVAETVTLAHNSTCYGGLDTLSLFVRVSNFLDWIKETME